MEIVWKTVVLRSFRFHRPLVVVAISNGDIAAQNISLELSPCNEHICSMDCYRRLDIHGTHRIRGRERVLQLDSRVRIGVPCSWFPFPDQKFKENPNPSSLAGRVDIEARHTLVTSTQLFTTSQSFRHTFRKALHSLQTSNTLPTLYNTQHNFAQVYTTIQ